MVFNIHLIRWFSSRKAKKTRKKGAIKANPEVERAGREGGERAAEIKGISQKLIGWFFSEWEKRPMQEVLSVAAEGNHRKI